VSGEREMCYWEHCCNDGHEVMDGSVLRSRAQDRDGCEAGDDSIQPLMLVGRMAETFAMLAYMSVRTLSASCSFRSIRFKHCRPIPSRKLRGPVAAPPVSPPSLSRRMLKSGTLHRITLTLGRRSLRFRSDQQDCTSRLLLARSTTCLSPPQRLQRTRRNAQ